MDSKQNEVWVKDVREAENVITSQWREITDEEKHQVREQVDKILRPLGCKTSLLVIERDNSIALIFLCLTLSALTSLRHQWRTRQLRDIVQELFTFLSGRTDTVWVNRLIWPLSDYERCLEFFHSIQGK